MTQVVVYKMCQFPYNIAVNKPIPGKTCLNNAMLFKCTDTKTYYRNRNKSRNKTVEYKMKKGIL